MNTVEEIKKQREISSKGKEKRLEMEEIDELKKEKERLEQLKYLQRALVEFGKDKGNKQIV
ncbi:23495_t:CDS:2 [Entrophospora sp. SA101]|nr:6747_t:CDS:2 [Entrophospora sp. SA101]CAJ0764944.1 23495_t:CDS:2 [Entrophospora sp. SA101]CAJ0825936.1 6950_t:CDS:2 [Entrophospora sp. SA101]